MHAHPAPELSARLLAHPLYAAVRDERALRLFMRSHVTCVWDFMTLLKALQRQLTCVEVAWHPSPDPAARRMINEIVLDEESDLAPGGGHLSHFELYREAMRDAGADGRPIDALIAGLQAGLPPRAALAAAGLPPAATTFARTTLDVALDGALHEVAAAFTWGREDVIPDMFRRLVSGLARRDPSRWGRLRHYLERHIERDGEAHGPAARALVARLCAGDPQRLEQARAAARRALQARLELWDALLAELRAADAPLAAGA